MSFRWLCSFLLAMLLTASAAALAQPPARPAKPAEWTILVYLNAKNNLEAAGLTNFYQMAEAGSNEKINVIVEFGRPKNHHTNADGNWSGVKRFRVTKGMKPRSGSELMDLGAAGLGTDMADPATLENFLGWGIKTYPSKRRMLVIWNHGQGWRFQLAADPNVKTAAAKQQRSSTDLQALIGVRSPVATSGGYRAVSIDDDSGKVLYNRQIQDVLEKLAGEHARFDVIGFDACLMSMIETAYAMRNVADYMVASQELEPNNGWNYRDVLQRLGANPSADALSFSKMVTTSYQTVYQNDDRTTLSTIDLRQISPLAESLSSLSTRLLTDLDNQRPKIATARASLNSFGDWVSPPLQTSIDLRLFLTQLQKNNPNVEIRKDIDAVLAMMNRTVIYNYRSSLVADDGYGGNGLAIYFPRDRAAFEDDPFRDGYLLTNANYPLEFITSPRTNGWAKLILAYLRQP